MAVEFQILDWIQNIRTPAGDVFMSLVTKLGNAGILWIVTAVVLASDTKDQKGRDHDDSCSAAGGQNGSCCYIGIQAG